jgi:PAS domain S-box-containing protein
MPDGQIAGRIAVVRDLTDRKRLEAALQEHLTRLQAILEHTTTVIYIMDADDRFLLINRRFAQLFQVTNAEVAGQPVEAVFAPEVAAAFRANNRAVREGRTPLEFEELVPHDDGLHTYLSVKVPLYGPDGVPNAICGISTDITARKRAEAALQAALQAKEVLLKEVYHRIKNNLQVVSSLLDMQADTLEDPHARAAFEDSQRRIQAMALIHESLYRADDLAHVNAADYLQQLSMRLFGGFQPSGGRIIFTLELEAVALEMHTAVPCGLILNELFSNAMKHAFPAGRAGSITIGLRRTPEGQVQLTVRDTGVGIPESLDVRATPSLGWQLVGLLTEQLGGTVALERHGGTTVTITFPLTRRG